ncbi:hypothetical protein [Salinicola avicenniae]|uniref:hypothetical protein n=1 Tax=Salinicola avicenniae TaxID=2916836 RepID=UPI00207432AE|nr:MULTISPECIES: hypothetical protein [unclassified Salinicola]
MSLIFLLLLAIVAAALVETVISQSRIGVVQQQSRSLFQALDSRLVAASRETETIRTITQTAQAGEPRDWQEAVADESGGSPSARDGQTLALSIELLRPGYDCLVTGYSSGSCLPVELSGTGEQTVSRAGSSQVLGLLVETINVSSGGDSRAGIFNGPRGTQTP